MLKAVAFSVGSRYAFSRRSSISFISLVAVLGLALSVGVLVVVISVVNGFDRELRERVFGMLPHLTLYGREPITATEDELSNLQQIPGVVGVVPFVQGAALATVAGKVSSVQITGIEPQNYARVSDLQQFLGGQQELLAGEFGVWLGAGVVAELQLELGQRVALVLPSATVTPAGLFPRMKRFTLRGIVNSRSEIDGRAAYIHQRDAQRLFRLGSQVHGYQLRLADLFEADTIAQLALDSSGHERLFARSWMRTHGNLYRAIGIQKTTMFVLLSFLVGVAAFNLVSTLVMVVDQRSSDVAILRTLGGDTATVVSAFVLLGVTLGTTGIALGLIGGMGFAAVLPYLYAWTSESFGLDLMNQYFVSYLPVEINFEDLIGIAVTALLLCILSTLYPAWRAARLRPSEVLAHE
ncbi:MAG: lipoprotein-releasing ABC transporter permease subunit [Gammaproteobacteria bacterium]|nr:lipoprotein-releasing ABC transporter permease subunit [Gammaproteobacteria bacterium]